MTTVEILENELRCVQRASTKRCDRECENCDLLMDTDDIAKAYITVMDKYLGEKE